MKLECQWLVWSTWRTCMIPAKISEMCRLIVNGTQMLPWQAALQESIYLTGQTASLSRSARAKEFQRRVICTISLALMELLWKRNVLWKLIFARFRETGLASSKHCFRNEKCRSDVCKVSPDSMHGFGNCGCKLNTQIGCDQLDNEDKICASPEHRDVASNYRHPMGMWEKLLLWKSWQPLQLWLCMRQKEPKIFRPAWSLCLQPSDGLSMRRWRWWEVHHI